MCVYVCEVRALPVKTYTVNGDDGVEGVAVQGGSESGAAPHPNFQVLYPRQTTAQVVVEVSRHFPGHALRRQHCVAKFRLLSRRRLQSALNVLSQRSR